MFSCLKAVRSGTTFFFCIILALVILIGIPVASLAYLITDPGYVKSWIQTDNGYKNVVDSIVNYVYKDQEAIEGMPIPKQELTEAAEEVFTPEWLQETTEDVIDDVYAWLNGQTDQLSFSIDLSEQNDEAQQAFRNLANQKIEQLPDCKSDEYVSPDDLEIFEATCVPAELKFGNSENYIGKEIEEAIFFENKDISATDLNISEDVTNGIQSVFQVIKNLPVIIVISILLATLLLFVLIRETKNKFFIIGLVWVIASGALLFGSYSFKQNIANLYKDQLESRIPAEQLEFVGDLIQGPLQAAYSDMLTQVAQFGIVIIVIGMIMLVGGFVMKISKDRYVVTKSEKKEEDEDIQPASESILQPQTQQKPLSAPQSQSANVQSPITPVADKVQPQQSPVSPISDTQETTDSVNGLQQDINEKMNS